MKKRGYSNEYQKIRKKILALKPICFYCKLVPADTLDHNPPLDTFPSPDLWVGKLIPSCAKCNYSKGAKYGNAKRKLRKRSRSW